MRTRIYIMLIICATTFLALPSVASTKQTAAPTKPAEIKVAAPFLPILPKLHKAKIPVYLPSWLPASCMSRSVYATASIEPIVLEKQSHPGYVVRLANAPGNEPCEAAKMFEISGTGSFAPPVIGRKVQLGKGRMGWLEGGGNGGPSICLQMGKNNYQIDKCGEDLIPISKSLVLVQP